MSLCCRIARETGLTRQTVYRIKGDPAGAEAALVALGGRATWGSGKLGLSFQKMIDAEPSV